MPDVDQVRKGSASVDVRALEKELFGGGNGGWSERERESGSGTGGGEKVEVTGLKTE